MTPNSMRTLTAALLVGVATLSGAGAARAEAPGAWLAPDGRDPGWVKATAGCRDLLATLKPDDPLVSKYLPNVQRGCSLLRRTASFDWKKRTAIDFLQNMLTDLVAGEAPHRRYAGKGVGFPYWSEAVRQVEAIWVHVPPGYDPAKSYQIFLYYKCGGGIHYKDGKAHGGYRPTVEVANQTDTFHAWSSLNIQVKGRMGADHELREATAALAEEFSIDPDRVFLTGWSDGGFTAVWLASRHPHLVAGIAPNCANWQYANVNQVGLYNVPMLAVDGWTDGGYNHSQFVRWQALQTMGYDVAGLWGHHGHSYQPYEDVVEFKRILDWAKTKRRDLSPKRVRYATWNLYWHRAFWFGIERMVDPCLPAQIDAAVKDGNVIDVRAWNVGAYRLALSDKLADPARPVTVVTNGKPSYSGPFRKELAVELVKPPGGKFLKTAAMPGGITTQVVASTYGLKRGGGLKIADRPWMWVKPTGLDAEAARLLAKWLPKSAKVDTEVTDKDIAGHNLFVLGGPGVNRLAAKIAADLPVKFAEGKFTIGKRVYDQPTNCVKFIHPNPLNPRKYVVLYAFNDAAAFAGSGFFGIGRESAWKFRSGDCVVLGVRGPKPGWGVPASAPAFETHHYIFDSSWQPPDETPVGELERPFGLSQLLRLRADAIREATGADVGVIGTCTPSYLRWSDALPAGPVTAHDLATRDMLPEYIVLADVKGSALYAASGGRRGRATGLLSGATASTVLADRRDPSYDPKADLLLSQIQPDKTYRVAMSYWGQPGYGAQYPKMPKLFYFRDEQEFLAGEHVSLPARNLRQTPTTVAEAVVRYVGKRKKVSPRPACFDLTQYILDPQINEFGACDWLHLGLDGDWQKLHAERPMGFRYTLSLGLRRAGDPVTAPPRKDSKQFADLDLAGAGKSVRIDFAAMGKKLPVQAAVEVGDVPVPDGKGRLVVIRLANGGPQDLAGLAVLSPTAQMRNNPNVFRGAGKKYIGLLQDYRTPTRAAMLVLDPADQAAAMLAPGAGWNAGLMGVKRTFAVKAGAKGTVAVFFVAVAKAAKSADHGVLSEAVEAARDDLMKLIAGR